MTDKKISALTGATTPLAGTEVLPLVQSGSTVKVAVSDLTAGRTVAASNVVVTSQVSAGTASPAAGVVLTLQESASLSGALQMANRNSTQSWKLAVDAAAVDDKLLAIIDASGGQVIGTFNPATGEFIVSLGNIKFGTAAKGINFTANTPAAGMTSQLLNWYEEGTWTPNQGAGLTVVGGLTATGTYTRIGRLVTVTAKYVAGTSLTIGAAGVVSTNLPFTALTESVGSITTNDVSVNGSVVIGGSGTTVYNAATITAKAQMFFTLTYPI